MMGMMQWICSPTPSRAAPWAKPAFRQAAPSGVRNWRIVFLGRWKKQLKLPPQIRLVLVPAWQLPSKSRRYCDIALGAFGPGRFSHSLPMALLAADDGVTLNFDFGLGYGQGGHGDEGAAGKIVAEYFPPELGKAITVAHVGDEHGHLHHVAELAAGLFERGIDAFEDLSHLPVEIAGEGLAGIIHDRELPGKPYGLAALSDHRLRVAALLWTFAFDEVPGMQRESKADQQRGCDQAGGDA